MKQIAFKILLKKHKDRVFNYALYFLRQQQDAEDVTQEVFIKLWQNWNSIDRNKALAWLMRVTHNLCINYIRKRKITATNPMQSSNIDNKKIPIESDTIVDPEMSYDFTEQQLALLAALSKLPERTKSMFMLHYFEGLNYEMIGEILDVNINTVKGTVHRGKKLLRKILEEQFNEVIN